MDAKDEQYHRRCLELAACGLGHVAPNPLVGAVIVADNIIIGEGFHSKFGSTHAEVNAIISVKDKELLKKSCLYVNLEPCSHFGKTPPCADLIIQYKIPKVVIGHTDPFNEVAGKGVEKLRNAGIEVVIVNYAEYKFLNRRFLTFYEKERPYIILKWAETNDGFIDRIRCNSEPEGLNWITDKLTKVLVHKWRTEEQAILVGTHTVMNDNPQLTAREWPGKHPIRLIPDIKNRLTNDLHVFDQLTPTYIFTSKNNVSCKDNLFYMPSLESDFPESIIKFCLENKIISIFIEGGTRMIMSFMKKQLWDEARVFKAQLSFGEGIKAPERPGEFSSYEKIGSSDLFVYYNKNNEYAGLG